MVSLPLANLWAQRSLVVHFAMMNTKLRYRGTYIGFLWAALEPLFIFVILYFVFTSMRIGVEPSFPIYLLTGVLFFQIFTRGTQLGLGSLRSNAGIIKSLNLKKEFFPVITAGSTGILMIVQVAVFLALMPIFEISPTWTMILFPIPLLLLLVLILGLSYIFSIIFVYVKDIQPAWSIFSYALFFISPVFWYLDKVDGFLLTIQLINPLGQIIELGHKIVFNEIPSLNEWTIVSAYVFGIFFFGYFIFRKFEGKIAEEL